MVLSLIPDSGKSGMGMGMDPPLNGPPSPANRGWGWGWTPDPRQIGDGTPIPIPGQIGDGDGDGDRGFRALQPGPTRFIQSDQLVGPNYIGQVDLRPPREGVAVSDRREVAKDVLAPVVRLDEAEPSVVPTARDAS